MKRIISFLAAVTVLFSAVCLSGCREKNHVSGVGMARQDYSHGVLEIPCFTGEGDAVDRLNEVLFEKLAPYAAGWESVLNDEVCYYEIKSYPLCTDRYKQVVTTAIELPNYGTHGDVFSFCYDTESGALIELDVALSRCGVSRETLELRTAELIEGCLFEGDVVIDISFPAFVFADGELNVITRAFIESEEEDMCDRLYIYNTAQDSMSEYDGVCLLSAGLCDRLDPPLSYERED